MIKLLRTSQNKCVEEPIVATGLQIDPQYLTKKKKHTHTKKNHVGLTYYMDVIGVTRESNTYLFYCVAYESHTYTHTHARTHTHTRTHIHTHTHTNTHKHTQTHTHLSLIHI